MVYYNIMLYVVVNNKRLFIIQHIKPSGVKEFKSLRPQ